MTFVEYYHYNCIYLY